MGSLLYPLAVILQDENTEEETTGLVKQAAETAQEIPEETENILQTMVENFFRSIADYLTSPTFIANVVATVIVVVLAVAFYPVPPST